MRKTMWRVPVLLMLAMAVLPGPANAATIVYRLTGLFEATVSNDNGSGGYIPVGEGEFTATGDTDDVRTGIGFTAVRLSSVTLSLGGATFAVRNAPEFYVYPTAPVAGFGLVWITGETFRSYDPATALSPVVPSIGAFAYPLQTDGGRLNVGVAGLRSFSATLGAAVPEPATWGMMIAGLALVGAAMRRQRGSPAAATARLR